MSTEQRCALEVKGLFAGYGTRKVLQDINLTVPEGRGLAILGANGSGKTTLFRCLTGLLPFEGQVRIFGKSLTDMKRDEIATHVALLSQMSEVYFAYTVRECVELGRYVRGVKTEHDREVIDNALSMCGLTDLENRPVDALSGGQLQRVFLARCLAQETPIILLDEPTNHLDLRYQNELMEYLSAWEKGTTTLPDGTVCQNTLIGVYHDIGLAAEVSPDLLFLKDGRVLAAGSREEVLTRDNLKEAYGCDVAGALEKRDRILFSYLGS